MAKKITETGPVGLKGIRNPDLYNKISALAESGNEDAKSLLSNWSTEKSRPFSPGSNIEAYFAPQQFSEKTPYATLGESQYDEPYIIGNDANDVNEIRYENQPWYDVLANGFGKMLGKAATTFVSSLVGIPYGIGAAINEGRWSALWDNDVTQGLSEVDQWLEKNMTNYQSLAQQQDPHFRLGDLNWWADNVITNVGFTLGAAASMGVGSGTLGLMGKSLGLVNEVGKGTQGAQKFMSALFSATGEGMIEAKQGVDERNKLELQKLSDALAPEREALMLEKQQVEDEYAATRNQTFLRGADGAMYDPAYELYKQRMADINQKGVELEQKYNAGKQQIIESGQAMGNEILAANQVLLTAGNLLQFSKGMTKSFDSARHAAEVSSKYAKPFGVRAERLADGTYQVKGKRLGRAAAATKGILTEGSEEMNQQWIQNTAGHLENEVDVNDYWRAKLDPESYRQTTEGLYTLGNAISKGFKESWGDIDQWEQFLIGAMTGATGIYTPTKMFNQDKTKSKWNPARYGSWEGGMVNELRDFNKAYNTYNENIDELNKILQSEGFPERVKSMVAHTYNENDKTIAAEADDKKAWKDADDKQIVHDIQSFLRAGKLDDLRAIYNEAGAELSDEDIDGIIKSTTKKITAEEDRQNFNRQADEQIAEHQRQIHAIDDGIAKITEDAQLLEEEDSRKNYLESVAPQLKALRSQQEEHTARLSDLESQQQTINADANSQIEDHQQRIYQLEQEKKEWQDKKKDSELLDKEEKQAYLNTINDRVSVLSSQIRQEKQAIAALKKNQKQQNKEISSQISEQQKNADALSNQIAAIENAPINPADYASSSVYRDAAQPRIDELQQQRDSIEQSIANLEQQKKDYVPKEYFDGAYVDIDGNQIVSNDEIRKTVKHNSEELNRKIDSYLESIAAVNKDTNGALTKDQEDNLAYLHHLGRESLVRADKIIANRRKELPTQFLMKTDKTPEQLTKEYATSDLSFSKDEDTKEGYVKVDTSMMDDRSFRNFFIRGLLWGGNIMPEFSETADERAAREEEEKNLPDDENKKRARERATKKWQDSMEKRQKDVNEQKKANLDLVDAYYRNILNRNSNASKAGIQSALNSLFSDIVDVSDLINQSGEYDKVLKEYMENPTRVDEDKAKAEAEAQKAANEQQAKKTFEGKDAKQMKQELASGTMDESEFFNFANMDLSGDAPAPMAEAQQEAKKAQEGNQKAAALKQHVQEQLGNNPTQQELDAATAAMQMIDNANLDTENPDDLNIDMPELNQIPLSAADPNASIEYIDALNTNVQQLIANAFNFYEEDKNAQSDIPKTAPVNVPKSVEAPETGKDAVPKTKPDVVAPVVSSPSQAASNPIPKNPLTKGAIDTIIAETSKMYDKPNTNGTWRSTTTRHPYGKSTGTYHESLPDKNSVQYKRSKAIWEYLNNEGAFDRQENASADRIKDGDVIHFMVKNFTQEMYGKDFGECTDEEKLYSLAIIMLNDNGEVIGDLPLAQLEPSYRSNNPTQQVKDLLSLQNKVFNKYAGNYEMQGSNEAVVDRLLVISGKDNLNLTFDSSNKPLLSKVRQVMNGAVPYSKSETNTLNDVANGQPFELGVAVTSNTIAKKRGDKIQHNEIRMPDVGTVGQPYLLLPAPSGEQVAVPFYMVPFNAEQHRNTEFYKILNNAMYTLLTNNSYTTAEQKEAFRKAMDVVTGLLQIEPQKGVRTVFIGADIVTFNFQSLTDPNQIITLSAPNASGNNAEIIRLIVDQMSGIPINVSLQFLNDTIEAGGRKANYNNVIGEIADVNLPKATNHTVNGWFTVELAPSAGIKPSKKVTPRNTGVITENIDGKNIEINIDTLTAYDPTTGEIIEGNEEVDLRLAQIKAAKPLYQDKDRIQVSINGELRTYDVKENKFVKNPTIKKEASATQHPIVNKPNIAKSSVSFGENKEIEITIPGMEGPNKIRAFDVQLSELKNGDEIAWTAEDFKDTEAVGRGIFRGAQGTDDGKVFYAVERYGKFFTLPSNRRYFKLSVTSAKTSTGENIHVNKSLEQIENEMKQKKVVGRQTKDTWDAIPDDLKLKLVNEGQSIQLSFNGKTMVVSLSDREGLIQSLTQANMAAKAGKIVVTEAPKFRKVDNSEQKRANIQKEKQWLQQRLPMFSTEDRLKFVQGLIAVPGVEGWAWGRFQSGIITLSDMAAAGTTYHEAFHAVTQTLLDDNELDTLYEVARERYKEDSIALLEELLAEDFRKYVQREETPIVGYIRKVFRRILNAMKNLGGYRDSINQLFYKINNGEFKDTLPRTTRSDNVFYNRVRTDRLLDKDHPMNIAIEKAFNVKRWEGDFTSLGTQWRKFKSVWQAEGYTPVAERVYSPSRKGKYIFIGVRTNADEAISAKERKNLKAREQYAAQQAREGRLEVFAWDRLTPEQQMNLMDSGMTQKQYEDLSLEEKEQWVKCHS